VTSRFSQTMSVSTAPISRPLRVSSIPKTNLPVSRAISSKNFWIRRFSWTNLTLLSESAASSIAWLNPFSPADKARESVVSLTLEDRRKGREGIKIEEKRKAYLRTRHRRC
jgi:hypothetical protein